MKSFIVFIILFQMATNIWSCTALLEAKKHIDYMEQAQVKSSEIISEYAEKILDCQGRKFNGPRRECDLVAVPRQ